MGKKGKRPSDGGQQGGEGKKRKKGDGAAESGELSELEQQISKDSQALDVLIGMIPAEHYKAPDPDKKAAMSAKYMKKDKTHEPANKAIAALKRARKKAKLAAGAGEGDEDDENGGSSDESGSEASEAEDKEEETPAEKVINKLFAAKRAKLDAERVGTPDELQARLQAKIAALRGGRPEVSEEERKAKRDKKDEKGKKKKEKKDMRQQPKGAPPAPMPVQATPEGKAAAAKKKKEEDISGVSFGRIKIGGEDIVGGSKGKEKKYKENPQKLLQRIEEKKQKVEELGGAATEEGKKLMDKQKWGAMIDRAQGIKVKDDPTLLQKTIKKKAKIKEKRKETWGEREQKIEKERKEKDVQRDKNIKARMQERKDKRMGIKKVKKDKDSGGKKTPGKFKARAGFEGKSPKPINRK